MDARRVVVFLWLVLGLGCSGGGDPAPPPKPKPVALEAGLDHTCALLSDGTVRCWGDNTTSRLGTVAGALSSLPVPVSGLTSATALAAGLYHTCALLLNSTVRCWGGGFAGQLGNGSLPLAVSEPVPVSSLTSAVALAAGDNHTCALLLNSTVRCWGRNDLGQLGAGTLNPDPLAPPLTPLPVTGLTSATALTAGGHHACALLADRTLACWGGNLFGELGLGLGLGLGSETWPQTGPQVCGSSPCSPTPVLVSGLTSVTAPTAWSDGTCALLLNSTVKCWGDNGFGALGVGRTSISTPRLHGSSLPVSVLDLTSVVTVAGGIEHLCAILADRTVTCWGNNSVGQLGPGVTASLASLPTVVPGLTSVTAVAGGWHHTCALLFDSTVRCWGQNTLGQLGIGTVTGPEVCSRPFLDSVSCSTVPVAVSGF